MSAGLRDIDVSTPAVVLKFDPNVLHHGGLGAIRSLGRLGVAVYGVHEGPLAPAAASRYLRGRFFWQADPAHAAAVRSGLLRLAERIGRPAVLITTDDAGAIFLAEQGQELRGAFLFPEVAQDLPRRLAGKYDMSQLCAGLGMPVPRTVLPDGRAGAIGFAAEAGFPVVAKLTSPWRDGRALRSTTIVATAADLTRIWAVCEDTGAQVMLQEYLPGGPGQDWFFHTYCDAAGCCRRAFTGMKDRSYPAHAGLTSLGRWVPNPVLRDQLSGLLHRLPYSGLADLDLRLDTRTGEYKLLDFNPRLGAQFRLFEDAAGVDVVRAAYLDLTGQPIPAGDPVTGRAFLVENYDPVSSLSYWRRGELGPREWARSLRGVREVAWFAPDDLRPFGLMCLRMSWRAASRRFTAGRATPPAVTTTPRYRPGRGRATHHATERLSTPKGEETVHDDIVDVAIVGAGPYGLSTAAHLRAAGVSLRQFGYPMHLWRSMMPQGMYLKSQGFASNLSDPAGTHTLEAFCLATARPYRDYGLPVPLETFLAYGDWFQAAHAPDLEETLVTEVSRQDGHYTLNLADGGTARARQVVIAAGVEHFAFVPDLLADLPSALCTHSSAHTDLAAFGGQQVIVVGAGQSALETAALLHENGAQARVVARRPRVAWNGQPLALDRPLWQRMREPEAGLGSGWSTWFYSEHPQMFRHLPESTRIYRSRTALGPAGASWLRARVEGQFPVLTSHVLQGAEETADGVALTFTAPGGTAARLTADHVIAATGYRPALERLAFLEPALRKQLETVAGAPVVRGDYQTSVPGLYVTGPAVAATMGPVMRFVFGTKHAARTLARGITATAGGRARVVTPAGR
jgi:FAD-dependent urate hydroxylase